MKMELDNSNSQLKTARAVGTYWLNGLCPNSRVPVTQMTPCTWKVPITNDPKIPLLLPTKETSVDLFIN